MNRVSPTFLLALLATIAFTLATGLELRAGRWTDTTSNVGVFTKFLGDGRKLFANQFITMADVYLHSGYYPSIFDQANPKAPKAITGGATDHDEHHEHEGHEGREEEEHEKAMNFLGQPQNWLDTFIRRFRITKHSHLEDGKEREVLPWLKIAIELDPQKIDTYVSAAYWLRKKLGRTQEAEQVLREGIRNNPRNAELLFEMGLVYQEGHNDPMRARHIWILALRRWNEQDDEARKDRQDVLDKIAVQLAHLEESAGNLPEAIRYFELATQVSPNPAPLRAQIEELRARLHGASAPAVKPVP